MARPQPRKVFVWKFWSQNVDIGSYNRERMFASEAEALAGLKEVGDFEFPDRARRITHSRGWYGYRRTHGPEMWIGIHKVLVFRSEFEEIKRQHAELLHEEEDE